MIKFLFSNEKIASAKVNIGLLIFRIAIGLSLAFAHGFGKLPAPEWFVNMVQGYGFPMPVVFAWAAVLAEFLGGLFIALGLSVRVTSAVVAFNMAVAFFIHHGADPFAKKELAFVYLVSAIVLIFTGAGKYSVDGAVNRG